tara:strand:- start:19328 stop:19528 length:201 start_codon:yes stop_codon:yes gene_type:complete
VDQDDHSSSYFEEPTKEELLREEVLDILRRAFFGLGIGNYDKDKFVTDSIMRAFKKYEEECYETKY